MPMFPSMQCFKRIAGISLSDAALRMVVAAGLLLFDAAAAYARAGGGGGYSSGGGSSSSSSSSYSSGGSSSGGGEASLFELVFWTAVLIAMIPVFRHMAKQEARRKAEREAEMERCIARIAEQDPGFDQATFFPRIEKAFLAIQAAWSSQDLSSVRGFMSDGLHERFSIQLREQAARGYRNIMQDVKVLEMRVVDSKRSAHFGSIAIEIKASATDYRVNVATGQELPNTRRAEQFREVWEFLRARDAETNPAGGLFEGQCPNCAAPVDPARAWQCESCESELSSAPPDWVLTEITQRSEWSRQRSEEVGGWKDFCERDPGLTPQQLEDRASVLFWRVMDAERSGSSDGLVSVSRPAFSGANRPYWMHTTGHYCGDASVGAVDLRGVIPGQEWDRALVEVRWAASLFERLATGRDRELNQRKLRRSTLVLARRAGAQSQIGGSVVSAHCGGCGAPDVGQADGACAYCGEVLNDGQSWLLERFLDQGDDEIALLLRESRGEAAEDEESLAQHSLPGPAAGAAPITADPSGTELLAWCFLMMYADGNVDRRERDRLLSWAGTLGVASEEARRLMRAAQFGKLEVTSPRSAEEARRWMHSLETMAHADGRIDRRERAVLEDFRQRSERLAGGAPSASE